TKCGSDASHLVVQLTVRQPSLRTVLIPEHQGVAVIAIAKQVFGEVESRSDKPFWSENRIRRRDAVAANEHRVCGAIRIAVNDDAAEPPHVAPELLEVANRPVVQRFEICDGRCLWTGGANLCDEA